MPVTVANLAADGKTSDQLRSEITDDNSLRQEISKADVILIGIGGADLSAGDDALSAGRCKGRRCYAELLRAFDVNVKAIAREARPGRAAAGDQPPERCPRRRRRVSVVHHP
jgi:hypothetical protein